MDTSRDNPLAMTSSRAVTRRAALRGLGGAGVATALAMSAYRPGSANEAMAATRQIEPDAGTWQTWILSSGDQLRPVAPPDDAATDAEMVELRELADERDAAILDRISYWDAGAPGYRWNEIATQQTLKAAMGPNAYRVLACLNAAIYDATVAAWDAKYQYSRARPIACDPELNTAIPTPNSPSYPCEHAVAAGTAATVLAYFFPDAADDFAGLAEEAARTRVEAGVVHPSDTAAGLALGKAVGDLAVAYAKSDGADAEFDPTTMPTGDGLWNGDPATLAVPTLGTWTPWVLTSGDQFRPAPPPAPDSPERAAEIEEVKTYPRDAHPFTELWFWPQDPAGRPAPDAAPFSSNQAVFYYAPVLHYLWGPELAQKLFEYRWDLNPPRAARAYALVSIASHDATIACWDAKFFYWTARPDQFDPAITTVVPTYPIPDYPSGHATGLAGTAEVLAYLFPRDERFFQSRAEENADSRLWAGIHFRSACEVGLTLGRDVGQAVIARAMQDGAA
jgi:membrane-associated phospholipid phosphatase